MAFVGRVGLDQFLIWHIILFLLLIQGFPEDARTCLCGHGPFDSPPGLAVRPHNAIYNPTGEILAGLPITIDPEMAERTWGTTARLAEAHRLTAPDAAYLELAQRLRLPLATQDSELIAAARGMVVG